MSSTHSATKAKYRRGALVSVNFGRTENNSILQSQPSLVTPESEASPSVAVSGRASTEALIQACRCATLSDESLDRKATLLRALMPAYHLYMAVADDNEAMEQVRREVGASSKGPKRDVALLCAQLIAAPGSLKARKTVSEYAAMLRFAEAKKIAIEGFLAFANETTLREAKAATATRRSSRPGRDARLRVRLIQRTGAVLKVAQFDVDPTLAPVLADLLSRRDMDISKLANSILTSSATSGSKLQEVNNERA